MRDVQQHGGGFLQGGRGVQYEQLEFDFCLLQLLPQVGKFCQLEKGIGAVEWMDGGWMIL